jgi:plasmid stabilization system protein ParE
MQEEMRKHNVILTWEAIYDITDIAENIEKNFGKNRADRFQEEIEKKVYDLKYNADVFEDTDIFYRGLCIKRRLFIPSIIFYIVKEQQNEVHVLRVLRQERDWENIMRRDVEYTYSS